MNFTPSNINKFLLFKLPSAYLCGIRLKSISDTSAEVTVKHRWINQNPFKSMYFAVQCMASELSTGVLVMKKIADSKQKVSMLVTEQKGTFTKKATGKIRFISEDGYKIDEALEKTIKTKEGVVIQLTSIGYNENNEIVSSFEYQWSLKAK